MSRHPVQVVAPIGRDAQLIAAVLERAGLEACISERFVENFTAEERDRMGALLIAEEALTAKAVRHLADLLTTQPTWSDLPVVVLTPGGGETADTLERQRARLPLGQVSLLERPARPSTLLSSVEGALRARRRQFEVRDAIAERDVALGALQQSEKVLRIATETAQIGTWTIDWRTKEMQCSETCKQNFGRSELESLSYADREDAVHPDDREMVQRLVAKAVAEHKPCRAEYRILWPDETVHWIVENGRFSYSDDGEALDMTGVTVDVTERHAAMATLVRTEKLAAVGRLSASIAHEINNPLESVTNLLYLARLSAASAEAEEYLVVAERELRRVSSIASQTLRFHKQQTASRAVTCEDLFASALLVQQGRLVNSGVSVEERWRAPEPVVCFDGEIRQVLNNLVGNAIDAMGNGGRMLLRSRRGTDWRTGASGTVMTVADTGPGISAASLKHIFDAFFTTKGIGGTGLGLWVSQEIVERHEGRMLVRSSTRPGRSGTVFSVFLPEAAALR